MVIGQFLLTYVQNASKANLLIYLGNYLYFKYIAPTAVPSPSPSAPIPLPTAIPTDGPSSFVWQGGAGLRYIETSNGLEITGNAGSCSGGRGFESSLDSFAGEIDVNATFTYDSVSPNPNIYPTVSVFPSQNSFSTWTCGGRIAVQYSSSWWGGYLYILGESSAQFVGSTIRMQLGSRYMLRLVHSLSQGTSTGYLYTLGSSYPLATATISEVYSRSVKVGFVDSNTGGWTVLSAFGVNGNRSIFTHVCAKCF